MTGNPFAADIFPDGIPAENGVPLHTAAMSDLRRLVETAGQRLQPGSAGNGNGGGAVVLLRAPRAGFGKSHLLSRLVTELKDRAFVVTLPFDREREVLWSGLLWQVLQSFHSTREKDMTLLDLVTRRVFAIVNQRMIMEKQVPCAHPAEALNALEERFTELFDFSNPAQPVARWFSEHFERLLPFAAHATAQVAGIPADAAAHWLRVLCSYAQGRPEGDSARWESLRWSVMQPSGQAVLHGGINMVSAGPTGEAGARERLVEFCRLAAAVRPLVLVFDDLDLFHQQTEPVQRIAGFIAELRRLLSRAIQVLSVNHDLWAQTFLKAVPSAIEDRITGSQINLGTINREEATRLIRARLTEAGLSEVVTAAFLNRCNLAGYFSQEAGRLVSPRALLRWAAGAWEEFERSAAEHTAVNGHSPAVPGVPDIPAVPLKVADAPVFRAEPPKPAEPAAKSEEAENRPEEVPRETTAPVPAPEGDPAFARLRETLQRLLTPLRPEEPEYSPPPFLGGSHAAGPAPASGAILTGSSGVTAPPERQTRPSVVPSIPLSPGGTLQKRFQQLRAHFLTAPWLAVDQERLFHLLKVAGHRFAVVKWRDYPLPGSPGQSAGAWAGPDGETLVGSEPYEDRTYWSSLIHFTRERSGHGFSARPKSTPPCRLVVFSAAKAPVNLSAWMPQDEIIDARTHFLEVLTVEQPVLAAIYAADEMMRDAERGSLGVSPEETFSMLVPPLEFLWKQMTRPLKT